MKKFFVMAAVALMTAMTFCACDDDKDEPKTQEKQALAVYALSNDVCQIYDGKIVATLGQQVLAEKALKDCEFTSQLVAGPAGTTLFKFFKFSYPSAKKPFVIILKLTKKATAEEYINGIEGDKVFLKMQQKYKEGEASDREFNNLKSSITNYGMDSYYDKATALNAYKEWYIPENLNAFHQFLNE